MLVFRFLGFLRAFVDFHILQQHIGASIVESQMKDLCYIRKYAKNLGFCGLSKSGVAKDRQSENPGA